MMIAGDLPPLSPEESAHGERVAGHLRERIAAAGGWLPFSRFMQEALYAPGVGYYMAARPLFGAAGDFVTAPELTPLFADCLANQLAELLASVPGADLVEFGAGSGRLALDLLDAFQRRGALPRRYRIVETSPALCERQRATLAARPAIAARVEWLDAPPADAWQGIAFANEVVDALPVDRFRIEDAGVSAVGVVCEPAGFAWQARPAEVRLADAVGGIQAELPAPMPAGFVSECRPGLAEWLAAATASLVRGALLVIDYGLPRTQYYHPSRDGGTLAAFRRHRRHEAVLAHPGLQDLTAWVDFSALAAAGRAAGLALAGFATQAHFLAALGIDGELSRRSAGVPERDRAALAQAASTLLLPGEMGERFKAMLLTRGLAGEWRGFGFRDLSESL